MRSFRVWLENLDRTHAVVLVGSLSLMISTFGLRLGLSGDYNLENILVSLALLVMAFGLTILVHSRAKPLRQSREEWKEYQAYEDEIDAVADRGEEIEESKKVNATKLHNAEAEEALLRFRDFDRKEKRAWSISRALTGYYKSINENTSSSRFGSRRTA